MKKTILFFAIFLMIFAQSCRKNNDQIIPPTSCLLTFNLSLTTSEDTTHYSLGLPLVTITVGSQSQTYIGADIVCTIAAKPGDSVTILPQAELDRKKFPTSMLTNVSPTRLTFIVPVQDSYQVKQEFCFTLFHY